MVHMDGSPGRASARVRLRETLPTPSRAAVAGVKERRTARTAADRGSAQKYLVFICRIYRDHIVIPTLSRAVIVQTWIDARSEFGPVRAAIRGLEDTTQIVPAAGAVIQGCVYNIYIVG